ncbi:hypothetical protein AYI68_g2354 [Smittium mucronatum]|uniref:Uncharacterized protein n=1 Tax=Smittium mucronatum TaxID=133383 RepID=A0A1R0H2W0_9FUNG|nr:hypothetical protein AYI68_g2354 [Smittium mucronatum]
MVMRNNESDESGAYPYGISTEVEAWTEVADDIDSDTLVSSSSEVLALGDDLDPSINLAGESVMEDLTSSLMGLSLSADPKSPGATGEVWIGGVRDNIALSVASSLATQQQFRSEDLYQSNWYRESNSDIINSYSS